MSSIDFSHRDAEHRINEFGIRLPAPPKPLGAYVEAVRSAQLVFFSGMLPVVEGRPTHLGRIGRDLSVAEGREAAATACLNGLAAAKEFLGSLDRIVKIPKVGVYIVAESTFRDHPTVADGASELIEKVFGEDKLSTRIVLGVATLPLGVPIELELVMEVSD